MAALWALITALLACDFCLVAGAAVDLTAGGTGGQGYAPQPASCPPGPLVRDAHGLSQGESAYISQRAPIAAYDLKAWLSKTDPTFANITKIPTLALAHSGGGYRSLLISAGAVQAFDARDGEGPLAGLLQGVTYQAALSGGAWLVSSLFGNKYPTISNLQKTLWTATFAESALLADVLKPSIKGAVLANVLAKQLAGFPVGVVDPYNRLLGYQFFKGPDGGVDLTMSGLATMSNFSTANVPYPIITSISIDTANGQCKPRANDTVYEHTPHEFGSWAAGVSAFTPMRSLGSNILDGQATRCVVGFDNLGFTYGTSSDIFVQFAAPIANTCSPTTDLSQVPPSIVKSDPVLSGLSDILNDAGYALNSTLYANYPNPFRGYSGASHVKDASFLSLVDGGESGQNLPIVPFLQPARAVDVLLAVDSSADTNENYPDGSAPRATYLQSLPNELNLARMPEFPDNATLINKGLNKRPTAFGCNDASKLTFVWLPNYNYTYQQAGQSTYKIEYLPVETAAMIANGNAVATRNNDSQWPQCLACIIAKKSVAGDALPTACAACFDEYCFN